MADARGTAMWRARVSLKTAQTKHSRIGAQRDNGLAVYAIGAKLSRTPSSCTSSSCTPKDRAGFRNHQAAAANPEKSLLEQSATKQRRSGRADQTLVRRDAAPGLSRSVRHLRVRDDGRQYRARHQLLGDVSEIPFAGARGVRHRLALAAVPVVLRGRRRADRPFRSAPDHPMRHGAVHSGLARLGLFLHHRHPADVAGHGASGDPRLRRRAVVHAGPGAALRYRRPGRSDERRSAQCHRALSRRAGRARSGRIHIARARTLLRHFPQHDFLSADGALAGERALRAALSHRRAAAATRGARPWPISPTRFARFAAIRSSSR